MKRPHPKMCDACGSTLQKCWKCVPNPAKMKASAYKRGYRAGLRRSGLNSMTGGK